MLTIDPTAKISALADIEASTRGTPIVVGPRTTIDAFVKIKPAGGSGAVEIGADCAINSGTVMYTGNGIKIGDAVLIAANCTLAPTNHEFGDKARRIRDQGFQPSRGGIVIGDDVWLGANTVVLDGAVIGRGCVIAAGSVVRGELEPYSIYAGVPAKRVGARGE
ncbi:acyltransferase [Phenylobacterium sp. LH3H17]|uniref:acyltransferase n=1 Tax=Phenylobacterium sp. LH3H17 TaxID=2903901 RepID=UPI0020C9652E|nr:acyltransferase [Phenylobacterium sp. LH3H17]UTP39127.1 acyltransferase [Phenylobacterium sp. LH3H17]